MPGFDSLIGKSLVQIIKKNLGQSTLEKIESRVFEKFGTNLIQVSNDFPKLDLILRECFGDGAKGMEMQLLQHIISVASLAKDAVSLCHARPLKPTDREVVVVTDPHYNTLKVHEIVGHPTELDRALKMETSYAGRSWLFRNLQEHQLGKPIASSLVSAFSDPSLPGYGHYRYDHEGTPGRRVMHIDHGIFTGFMNSRQTAAILGIPPNGSYKAADASLVPLIRMSNTVFGPGERDPQEIIREIPHGDYLVGHRTPSISESRENF